MNQNAWLFLNDGVPTKSDIWDENFSFQCDSLSDFFQEFSEGCSGHSKWEQDIIDDDLHQYLAEEEAELSLNFGMEIPNVDAFIESESVDSYYERFMHKGKCSEVSHEDRKHFFQSKIRSRRWTKFEDRQLIVACMKLLHTQQVTQAELLKSFRSNIAKKVWSLVSSHIDSDRPLNFMR